MRVLLLSALLVAGCSGEMPGPDAAASDAVVLDDGASIPDDAPGDAGSLVDAPSGDAPACADDCRLHPLEYPASCSGVARACRLRECSTFCGDVVGGDDWGTVCTSIEQCTRGAQCLRVGASGSLTCQRFCRLSLGAADCAGIGSTTCVVPPLVMTEDDLDVVFPDGIGLCR